MAEFRVGDEAAYRSGYGRGEWVTTKVERETPSGNLRLSNGWLITAHGRIKGRVGGVGSPFDVEPVTPEIRKAIAVRRAREWIELRLQSGELSDDQILRMAAIADERNEGKEVGDG